MKRPSPKGSTRGRCFIAAGHLFCAIFLVGFLLSSVGTLADTQRVLLFSGYEWGVRKSDEPAYPGPNCFSDSTENVWVDDEGLLHLRATERDGRWYCAEVNLNSHLGYGTYVFQVEGAIGALDRNVVLGMFNYDSDTSIEHHREFDIEFSRWGRAVSPNAEYVVQPWTRDGNLHQWEMPGSVELSTHSYNWERDSISFAGGRGRQVYPPFDSALGQWTYTDETGIPEPGREQVTLNLWLFEAEPPSDSSEPEVVFSSFEHFPSFWVHKYDTSSQIRLFQNEPNPLREYTAIRFEVGVSGSVSLAVCDVTGRRIRTLVSDFRRAGLYHLSWDGLDDSGVSLPSGVYFCHLIAGQQKVTRSMVLVR